jgi:G3E family GTPase
VAARYALSGVVTAVDAEHGARTLEAHREAVKQVAMADRLVVTKVDRVPADAVAALEARLATLNPAAPILRSRRGDADPRSSSMQASTARGARRTPPAGSTWAPTGRSRRAGTMTRASRHSCGPWRARGRRGFRRRAGTLVQLQGARILRMKGLVQVRGAKARWPSTRCSTRYILPPGSIDGPIPTGARASSSSGGPLKKLASPRS